MAFSNKSKEDGEVTEVDGNSTFSTMAQPVSDIQPDLTFFHNTKQAGEEIDFTEIDGNVSFLHDVHTPSDVFNVTFLVHGYFRNGDAPWLQEMKDALLSNDKDICVLVVDWGQQFGYGARGVSYGRAVANVSHLGCWLGTVAAAVKKHFPRVYLHGIGHSLGAHLLGHAGRTSRVLDRITGLDPAGPKYDDDEDDGLVSSDALGFVDVIHTDGKTLGFGTLRPMGSVDFYPNGGKHQPSTPWFTNSHSRAHDLYTWSITNPGRFVTDVGLAPGSKPSDPVWVQNHRPLEMGYHCRYSRTEHDKVYYLTTNGNPPWV